MKNDSCTSSGNECSVCILSGNSWVSPTLILINSNSNDWQHAEGGCVSDMVVLVEVILPSVLLATINESSVVAMRMATLVLVCQQEMIVGVAAIGS